MPEPLSGQIFQPAESNTDLHLAREYLGGLNEIIRPRSLQINFDGLTNVLQGGFNGFAL
jgi:hypothetical protein